VSDQLLAVASCSGPRCRAVRTPSHTATLRAAVAGRPHALLVSTGCLGPCHLACVVAVGPAVLSGDHHVDWTAPPRTFALAERAGRSAALAGWISAGAPDPAQLPAVLRDGDGRRTA
jgi:hypothetical protein